MRAFLQEGVVERPAGFSPEATERERDALREKRGESLWYLVVGVAMLFASGFHVGLAVGGVLMVGFGAVRYGWYNRKMRAVYDPWKDPEIDAWEETQLRE